MSAELAVARPFGRATRLPILPLLAFVSLALGISYLASPYVALWQLGQALRAHDCATLRVAIDWQRVRDGLRTEFDGPAAPAAARAATDPVRPALAQADEDLPAFGESFASNAVDKALDENVTPEHVSTMLGSAGPSAGLGTLAEVRHALTWAFFSGPRSFDVWVKTSSDLHAEAVRLTMAFTRQHGWRVINVWVPQTMLDQAPAHST